MRKASPELRTERLLLRQWRDDDLAPFAAINADLEVARYVRRLGEVETAAWIEHIRERWRSDGHGLWAVERLDDGSMIGFVGLNHHGWFPDEVEVGWRLASSSWGRGLATEGGAAALECALGEVGLKRVISIIHRDNAASRRVAEKIGLRPWREEVRTRPGEGPIPIVVYASS
ncbi:MAG TPA: GNAT family N-acetyltransferase [Candidatus Dormibacteraeota bacterium]|jgi:RimJ/RimL family protein N-acetyltransferase|nr:GNAT family N-acetyltransferase [Candidatus Dormibacteraeota bacterium]